MKHTLLALSSAAVMLAADSKTNALSSMSSELEAVAATVAPAVVQLQVSGWCASESTTPEPSRALTACHVVGSGVIVDSAGYIITNEHVIRNARQIRAMLTPKVDSPGQGSKPLQNRRELDDAVVYANQEPFGKRQLADAVVVGVSRDTDLALLKIDRSGLPAIDLERKPRAPRQGQIVLAIGSPEGLDNTVTMGVISSVGRQPHPDHPLLFVQTDAAINPGNSGGPLLSVDGDLIGINTFMLSENGRNQGLGFAVPAAVVRYVYHQLKTHGSVRQNLIGIRVQTVTPALADGLSLSRHFGLIISDVWAGGPAELVGLKPLDLIVGIDGAPISSLPYYTAMMFLHDPGLPVQITVLRGNQELRFEVPSIAVDDELYKDVSVDPYDSWIPELRVFGKTLNPVLVVHGRLRSAGGVFVLASAGGSQEAGSALTVGDVILSLNGISIETTRALRAAIQALEGRPMIFQVERQGQFLYLELDAPYSPILSQSNDRHKE